MPYEVIREFPDRGLAWLLATPERLRDVLAVGLPDLASRLAPGSLAPLPAKLVSNAFHRRDEDVIYEATLAGPPPPRPLHLLVAHQSAADPLLPFRLLEAEVFLWRRDLRLQAAARIPLPGRRLRPPVALVVHTGARPWRPGPLRSLVAAADDPALARTLPSAPPPRVLDLAAVPEARLLDPPTPTTHVLALFQAQHRPRAAFAAALRRVLRRLRQTTRDEEELRELTWFALQLVEHRRPEDEAATLEPLFTQAVGRRELSAMTRTIGEAREARGFERGVEKGIEKGRGETQIADLLAIL